MPPALGRAALPFIAPLLMSALGLLLLQDSWHWPLMHDVALLHFIAAQLEAGRAPYRDLFDMNFPGAYLLHLGLLKTIGTSDLGWRLFDLGVLALFMLALLLLLRPVAWPGRLLGALTFMVFHLINGPMNAGQRDYVATALAFGALALCWHQRSCWRFFLAGMLIGAAATIKPVMATVGLFPLATILMASGTFKQKLAPLAALVTGATLPVIGVLAWLWQAGSLPAFFDILLTYTLPLYSQTQRLTFWRETYNSFIAFLPLALVLVGAVGCALFSARRNGLGLGLLVWGVAYATLQDKGWAYHFYPLYGALAFGVGQLAGAVQPRTLATALFTLLLAASLYAQYLLLEARPTDIVAESQQFEQQLGADLQRHNPSRAPVLVLDTTAGLGAGLLQADIAPAGPFIYDFPFFVTDSVETEAAMRFQTSLRAKLIQILENSPPAFVLLSAEQWPRRDAGYDRWAEWPDFMAALRGHYTLAEERSMVVPRRPQQGYRIYVRTSSRH